MFLPLFSTAMAATLDVGAGHPYPTLADAFAAATSGDVIALHAGDHELDGDHTLLVDNLTVRGEGRDVTVVRAPVGSTCTVALAGAGTLEMAGLDLGCDLQASQFAKAVVSEVTLGQSALWWLVDRATFTDVGADPEFIDVGRVDVSALVGSLTAINYNRSLALRMSGSRFVDGGRLWVQALGPVGRVEVHDSWFCGAAASEIRVDQAGSVLVEGNRFVGNGGGSVFSAAGALELFGPPSVPLHVTGNVFYGNDHEENPSLHADYTLLLDHNIFARSTSTGAFPDEVGTLAAPARADHNLWFDLAGNAIASGGPGGNTVEPVGAHMVLADPMFVNPSLDCDVADFGLLPGSPAIDAGHPSQLDADGTARDIGL